MQTDSMRPRNPESGSARGGWRAAAPTAAGDVRDEERVVYEDVRAPRESRARLT